MDIIKIAVTGHTSGIGAALFETYELRPNIEVYGFSRSNGFDINDPAIRETIVNQVGDFDVFINCAYCDGQTQLMHDIVDDWIFDDGKHYIHIGSANSIRRDADTAPRISYATDKLAQRTSLEYYQDIEDRMLKISCLEPGMVNTPYNKEKTDLKLPILEVEDMVEFVRQSNVEIRLLRFSAFV